jgi:hypothetical protein
MYLVLPTYICFVSNRFASSRLKFFYIKHLQHTNTCSYACPAPWRGPRWGGASPVPLVVQSLTHGDSPRLERGGRQRSPWSCRSHLPSQAPRKTQHHMGSITPTTRTHTSRQVPFGLGQSPRCGTALLGSEMPLPLTKTYCCHQGTGTCIPPLGSPRALAVVTAPAAAT